MKHAPGVKPPLTTFKATLPLKNGYAPVMRWVLKICPDQMKRNKVTHEGMRQVYKLHCLQIRLALENWICAAYALGTKNLP